MWYVDYLYKVSSNVNTYTFNTFNFVADKQITKNLHVYAGVDNIFDKTLPYDENHSYTIDGRTWRVGAEMTFKLEFRIHNISILLLSVLWGAVCTSCKSTTAFVDL